MRRLAIPLAALCATACVQTVELASAIQPTPAADYRSSEAAGVVCNANLLAHVERERSYALALGEPLCATLVASVASAYRSAERTEKPLPGQYGRVIQLDLHDTSLHVERTRNGAIRVACGFEVAVGQYGRDMKQRSRNVVTGHAIVERWDARPSEVLKEAAESALRQLADNASSLLVADIDGPRVRGAASEDEAAPAAPER